MHTMQTKTPHKCRCRVTGRALVVRQITAHTATKTTTPAHKHRNSHVKTWMLKKHFHFHSFIFCLSI